MTIDIDALVKELVGGNIKRIDDLTTYMLRQAVKHDTAPAVCEGGASMSTKEGVTPPKATASPEAGWQPIETAPRDGTPIKCQGSKDRDYYCRWAWSENAGVNTWCGEIQGLILPITPPPTCWSLITPPTPSDDEVERGAVALFNEQPESGWVIWPKLTEEQREGYRKDVRAVISTMKQGGV